MTWPNSICVTLTGFDHLSKETHGRYGDTFSWVAGPSIRSFCDSQQIPCRTIRSSDTPDETVFYFPEDRPEIAMLIAEMFDGRYDG